MTFVKESVTCTRCGASWETIPDMVSPHFCLTCLSSDHTRATPLNAWVRQNSKADASNPLSVQEGGSHYKQLKIQPVEYIHANDIGFIEGNVIKYVTRHKEKNGKQDLEKAIHCLKLLIKLQYDK